ncbi:hypothetical protein WICPIJ_006202 [Wickerhamomyces pijperi]|uniref:Uncharacterized protein n=1 Tax=Wickerhamomyces pijperi TaxID=599730 RepID=A0A9P8Q484_WICPI|nr:hypothetical protein WICPIJ_006202 [Wickerhamomyces pijperi]
MLSLYEDSSSNDCRWVHRFAAEISSVMEILSLNLKAYSLDLINGVVSRFNVWNLDISLPRYSELKKLDIVIICGDTSVISDIMNLGCL